MYAPQGVRSQGATEKCLCEHRGTALCVHVLLEQAAGTIVCCDSWVVDGSLGLSTHVSTPLCVAALQISKALLNDDSRLRLPRFLEDDTPKDPEATKQDLIDKIAQLNASIDEVAAQLKSKDSPEAETVEAAASLS